MNDKQILDRLESINLSLRQKQDLIDVIKDIIANSGGGGGGASTDKDTLDIYIDWDTKNVIIDDKVFVPEVNTDNSLSLVIRDKKLYSTLYSSLVNTNTVVYIKTIPTNEIQIFGIPSYIADETNIFFAMLIDGFVMLTIANN